MYELNEAAKFIAKSDYLLEGETPEQMFMRVAKQIASVEKTKELQEYWTDRFYQSLLHGDWICATPFLMNAGVNNMFSSCFVVGGLKDDLHSIFQVNERSAIITKMGGGIGLNISKLREKDAYISSTKGKSTGAISFMKVFNTTLDVVMQARRRGAGIIVMDIYHPDIEEFITCKSNHSEITNFNISVLIDDNFMKAVKENKEVELKSPVGYVTKTINAKDLFMKIATNARYHAEPGIVYKTTINKNNPNMKNLGEIDSVNACGEIPLYDDEACNLSAINLQAMVDKNGKLNEELLQTTIETMTRFLDNSIDINNFPDEKIKQAVFKTRKLGIGVMGLNSMLVKKGFPYDSNDGRKFAKKVFKLINDTAMNYSCKLIDEGRELPNAWYDSTFEEQGIKIRNLSLTSGQPTGATQIFMDEICASSGIETFFAIVYKRKIRDTYHILINSLFRDIGKSEGWLTDQVIQKILENNGSCQDIQEVPVEWQKLFKTSLEVSWEDHIKMQSELQKHTTNALSKTINMSQNTTVEDVYNAFMLAHDLGCKGSTVYVQNSRDNQVLSAEKEIKSKEYVSINPTLDIADAKRLKVKTGCGSMWLFLINDEYGNLCEVFSQSGSSGGCQGMTMALTRMISLGLKANVNPTEIIEQLQSVKCDVSLEARKKDKTIGKSCADGIARHMIKYLQGEIKADMTFPYDVLHNIKIKEEPIVAFKDGKFQCPECGEYTLEKYDGCVNCSNCTYQRCH